ncbi:MAG TPA: helix-turn-helix domain-containing protein [Sinomonas sp.]|nr:helix-turn-helix domain-containing protein [Sinomonas sp.]
MAINAHESHSLLPAPGLDDEWVPQSPPRLGRSPSRGAGPISEAPRTEYLTRAEAAARCRVPLPTFDKLRREGLVPPHDAEVGRHKLWRAETIEEFLNVGGTMR